MNVDFVETPVPKIKFYDLQLGETFLSDGQVYIKSHDYVVNGVKVINSIDIEKGSFRLFDQNTFVRKIVSKVTVEV